MIPSGNRLFLLLILAATLLANPAAAFTPDSDEPIKVSANSARLDDSAGTAVYTGAVELVQGEVKLDAERVVLYRSPQGLSRIEASGSPAVYRQPSQDQTAVINAEARNITWSAKDNQLTFEREALIEQGGSTFRGDIIHYDTVNRVVTAEGGNSEGTNSGRVEMVIQPRSSGQ
ncbi:lipopolysaccharide transport periplasmic protein LptA [Marinobacter sp. S0848L]|uniref:lipopolysaccharide transport periplasmic protein LptA n=1 Tax=Marinobacter sp. S0848L TaxID=2926423 RepID=UPI001FF2E5FB|nr:lipopolysaccharide transport periplasmic protein LptA [Marinobacter sp. S0848L]MCK0107075.1 lipopolysaccharide transport periplasmic protein LptA [Marinobacter sp. S0848L]